MEAGVAMAIDSNRHQVCFVFKLRSGYHPETVPQASNNIGKQGRKAGGRAPERRSRGGPPVRPRRNT